MKNPTMDNNYRRRRIAAKLPATKNLEEFDFSFQPSIDARVINDLSTCSYINAKENIILIGDSGTGKTHLAIGLALKALAREYFDELGFKQLPKHNKDFDKWNEIFADELLSRAIIDRVIHHAHILIIKGKSYRINKSKSGGNMA